MRVHRGVTASAVLRGQADSVDMDGYLQGCDGAVIHPPTTSEKQDILSIGTLLSVMQVRGMLWLGVLRWAQMMCREGVRTWRTRLPATAGCRWTSRRVWSHHTPAFGPMG